MIAKEKIVKLVVLVEVGICLIAFMHFQFKSFNCVPAAWLSTILLIIALLAVFIKNVSEWKRFLAFRYPLSDVYPNYAKEGGENHVG